MSALSDPPKAAARQWIPCRSPPSAALEPQDRQNRAGEDQRETKLIAVTPAQLGHVVKVHAVHARDQRRWNSDDGDHRQHLEDVILICVDEAQNGIEQEM